MLVKIKRIAYLFVMSAVFILVSTWWKPITIDMPHIWGRYWKFPFCTHIRWGGVDNLGHFKWHNDLTIDLRNQLHWWFPSVVKHPKRWPRGSA